MNSRFLIRALLIALGLVLIASTSTQGSGDVTTTSETTLTSLDTYTVATSAVSTVLTSTLSGGDFTVYSWWTSGCSFWSASFNAQPGDEVIANLKSTPVDFYLMSQVQVSRIRSTVCNPVAAPVWPSILHYTEASSKSIDWSPTYAGVYYFVLVNFNTSSAQASFSGYVRSLGTVTLLSYSTLTSEIVQSQTLTENFNPTTSQTQQQTATPSTTSTIPMITILEVLVAVLIVAALLVLKILSRPKREDTRVY
jgi:hypothetical protein